MHQGRDVVSPQSEPEGTQLRDGLERSEHLVTRRVQRQQKSDREGHDNGRGSADNAKRPHS